MAINITTTAFENGSTIPKNYTCSGLDISPQLKWSDIPNATKSFCIIVDDPDAPMGTWTHWMIYNIPKNLTELPENIAKTDTLPDGTRQGINDFQKVGYGGPCPPPGPTHRYYFKIHALDVMLNLPARATRKELDAAIKGHVIGRGELMGTFGR